MRGGRQQQTHAKHYRYRNRKSRRAYIFLIKVTQVPRSGIHNEADTSWSHLSQLWKEYQKAAGYDTSDEHAKFRNFGQQNQKEAGVQPRALVATHRRDQQRNATHRSDRFESMPNMGGAFTLGSPVRNLSAWFCLGIARQGWGQKPSHSSRIGSISPPSFPQHQCSTKVVTLAWNQSDCQELVDTYV